mmetsp:Transcript_85806/g.228721  ORF Transcript_85806/g.228721 Transcript_85806/m.228721 type:complete len:184 (+) Transcript_85806:147-698(+)
MMHTIVENQSTGLSADALKQHAEEWSKLGKPWERSLSSVSSGTTVHHCGESVHEEEEPLWEFFELESEGESFDCGSCERRVLFCEEHEVAESKYEEVPFPYIRRGGRILASASELVVKAATPRKLRASGEACGLEGLSLEEKYKWRQQFDGEEEETSSKLKRAVAFVIAQLKPVPTSSEFTPY